jgi:hypothetical protein
VFLSIALSTITSKASGSNSKSTPSNSINFLYCLIRAFLGLLTISIKASFVNPSNVATIGSLPTNSGISPNFNKSCGNNCLNISVLFISFLLSILAPKPIVLVPILSLIMLSKPSKAPPHINNIFDVSICIKS